MRSSSCPNVDKNLLVLAKPQDGVGIPAAVKRRFDRHSRDPALRDIDLAAGVAASAQAALHLMYAFRQILGKSFVILKGTKCVLTTLKTPLKLLRKLWSC